jgi:TnpA family transposase
MFQRIIASLALRTTTQSILIKKLSSYRRINNVLLAFIEYNDVIKSIFMLD